MDVVIRIGVRIEMHWPLFSIGTLKLNTSQFKHVNPQKMRRTNMTVYPINISLKGKQATVCQIAQDSVRNNFPLLLRYHHISFKWPRPLLIE